MNITANAGMKMREVHDVMNTIKDFTADDATVIVGTVIDEDMHDDLRVTMVATGLGGIGLGDANRVQPKPLSVVHPRASADNIDSMNWKDAEGPASIRTNRQRDAAVEAMKLSGVDILDIPAFLRKQAD